MARLISIIVTFAMAITIFGALAVPATASFETFPAPDSELSDTTELFLNVTQYANDVNDIILTIDGNTEASKAMIQQGSHSWSIDCDTTDLENGQHSFKYTVTYTNGTASSVTNNYTVQNDIRIVMLDTPEITSGFLYLQAEIIDERLDPTNNWYIVDGGPSLLLPQDDSDLFSAVIDVSELSLGLHDFTVKAINADLVVKMKTVTVTVDNSLPNIEIIPPEKVDAGVGGTFNLTVLAGGEPVTVDNVYYGVDNVVWDPVPHTSGFKYEEIVPTTNLTEGTHQLFVRVEDANGQTLIQKVVEIQGAKTTGFPILIFILALAAAVILTAVFVVLRTRKKVIAPDDVFLIYSNGLLIRHISREGLDEETSASKPDDDLVTSMLVAIQGFVKDSFSAADDTGGDLKHIGFGDKTILLEKSKQLILAYVVSAEPKDLGLARYERHMGDISWGLVSRYSGKLEDWDGDIDAFPGIEDKLAAAFNI